MKNKTMFGAALLLLAAIMCISCTLKGGEAHDLLIPTEEELRTLPEELISVLGSHFRSYDCSLDNAYENSFCVNHLHAVVPASGEDISQYIAQPLDYYDTGSELIPEWQIFVSQNDPLGKFPRIHESVYDENGDVDEDKAFELLGEYSYDELVIGYNMYSGLYLDWIVENVWNGKVNHEDLMKFEDSTQLYYHDGFYYTPEYVGDRGGDGYIDPTIDYIQAVEDGRYEIVYHFDNYLSEPEYCRAVVGLKETQNGFRFWSIFSIELDIN